MAEEVNYWETVTGLPLDGATATVVKEEFRFDNAYKEGACVLALTFHVDGQEDREQLYSVGKGFEPQERGASAGHTSGKPIAFYSTSNYGRLIASAKTAKNSDAFMSLARERQMQPNQAGLWHGTTWVLKGEKVPGFNGGEDKTAIVFGEFVGSGDAPTTAATASAPAVANDDVPEEIQAQLVAAATDAKDFDSYMEAVMEIAEVAEDQKLQRYAMSSKPGSVWAQHGK
jgi:hypothetical protein